MRTLVEEYKDKKGEVRIRVRDLNNRINDKDGEIIDSSHEGYKNRDELIHSELRSAYAIIDSYGSLATADMISQKIVLKRLN